MSWNDWTKNENGNLVRKTTYRAELWEDSDYGMRPCAALHHRSNGKAAATNAARKYIGRMIRTGQHIPYEVRLSTDYETTHVWDISLDKWVMIDQYELNEQETVA